jgi:hypothetical protein
MHKVLIFFIVSGCALSTAHLNTSSIFVDVKKANFVNGKIVLADKNMSQETGICFVEIRNINYDTVWVDQNSIILDSIEVVAPTEIVSITNSNLDSSPRVDYLTRFPIKRNYILKGDSKQFLFRNEMYYSAGMTDIINIYRFFADSMQIEKEIVLEINSKNLTSKINSL